MPKTANFTTITPLPSGVTRKSVVEMFQDHLAMIDLNPLVVERFRCRPPSYATTDEYYQTWYTIKDKVSYLPGGLATGSVSYHACFNDVAEGLETHVYAPLGLDIRGKWSVGGSLPGEPKPPGPDDVNAPRNGLYIREDVQMTCSALLIGFVKRTFKDSHASLVEKLVERAHILESNFANERLQALRNVEPAERMATGDIFIAPPPDYQPDAEATSPQTYSSQPSPRTPLPEAVPAPPFSRTSSHPSPLHLHPTHATHSRSHSDPVTPGFSSASTLYSDSCSPTAHPQRPSPASDWPLKSTTEVASPEPAIEASSPAPSSYFFLLPATTYDGGFSQKRKDRTLSLYPSPKTQVPLNDSHPSLPDSPPRVSYTPEDCTISFALPGHDPLPLDTHSISASSHSSERLLPFDTHSVSASSQEPSPLDTHSISASSQDPSPFYTHSVSASSHSSEHLVPFDTHSVSVSSQDPAPLDTRSIPASSRISEHLFDDMDDAIDQCFRGSVVPLGKEGWELVTVKAEAEVVLLPTVYDDGTGRKDSIAPYVRKDSIMPRARKDSIRKDSIAPHVRKDSIPPHVRNGSITLRKDSIPPHVRNDSITLRKDSIPPHVRNDSIMPRKDSIPPHVRKDSIMHARKDSIPPHVRKDSIMHARKDSIPPHFRKDSIPPHARKDSIARKNSIAPHVSPHMRKDSIPPFVRKNSIAQFARKDSIMPYGRKDSVAPVLNKELPPTPLHD